MLCSINFIVLHALSWKSIFILSKFFTDCSCSGQYLKNFLPWLKSLFVNGRKSGLPPSDLDRLCSKTFFCFVLQAPCSLDYSKSWAKCTYRLYFAPSSVKIVLKFDSYCHGMENLNRQSKTSYPTYLLIDQSVDKWKNRNFKARNDKYQ